MIDRNYSTLTMKRRAKRRDWRSMAIGIALVLGIILVAIAFIFRDDAGDIPEAPESRSITAHASTNTVELDDNTSPELAMVASNDSARPAPALAPNALGSPGAPNTAPNAAKQPAIGQMPNRLNAPNAHVGDNTRHAQAMVDLLACPSNPEPLLQNSGISESNKPISSTMRRRSPKISCAIKLRTIPSSRAISSGASRKNTGVLSSKFKRQIR